MAITNSYLKGVYDGLVARNPEQKEFLQAVEEVLADTVFSSTPPSDPTRADSGCTPPSTSPS